MHLPRACPYLGPSVSVCICMSRFTVSIFFADALGTTTTTTGLTPAQPLPINTRLSYPHPVIQRCVTSMVISFAVLGHEQIYLSSLHNGILGGLVAITANCKSSHVQFQNRARYVSNPIIIGNTNQNFKRVNLCRICHSPSQLTNTL